MSNPNPKKKRAWNVSSFSKEIKAGSIASIPNTEPPKDAKDATPEEIEKVLANLQNGSKFAQVLSACAMIPKFWFLLGDIRYVQMLTCVCKNTKELLEPTPDTLPFWGTWVNCLRGHTWKEIRCFMNVKSKHLQFLKDASYRMDETRVNSKRMYNLHGVWNFMVGEYGSIENYAKSIVKFRHFRKIAIKRRITYASKHPLPKVCKKLKKSPSKMTPEEEKNELFNEFGRAITLHIPLESFASSTSTDEDNAWIGRPWNMLYSMCLEGEKYDGRYIENIQALRTLIIMHHCLRNGIRHVLAIIEREEDFDAKKVMIQDIVHEKICPKLFQWFRQGSKSMEALIKSLNQRVNGMLDNPKINHAIFSKLDNDVLEKFKDNFKDNGNGKNLSNSISKMHQLIVQEFVNHENPQVDNSMTNDNGGSKDQEEDEGYQEPMDFLHNFEEDEDFDDLFNNL